MLFSWFVNAVSDHDALNVESHYALTKKQRKTVGNEIAIQT